MRNFVKNISKHATRPYIFLLIFAFVFIWMIASELFVIEFDIPNYFALIIQIHIFIIFACIFTKYEDDILTMEKRKFIRHCIYLFTSLILYAVEFILLIRLTYIGFISHLLK